MTNKITILCNTLCIFIVSILVYTIQAQWPTDEDSCRIPGSGFGECTSIYQCNSIMSFLEFVVAENINLTTEVVELLRSYQCDYHSRTVKVCCPKEMLFSEPVFTRYLSLEELALQTINNHKNLHLLPYDCGIPQSSDRISGGNITSLGEFPWMVLINYITEKGSMFKCGGTIINRRYILTAAHCITNLPNLRPISVRAGEHNLTSLVDCEVYLNGAKSCAPPVQDILIEELLPHPEFNPAEFVHDIGLIRLATPINTNLETARPICIPVKDSIRNLNFTNTKLTVTGWGLTEFGKISEVLLKVNIPMLDRSECERTYQRSAAKISQSHLCGGGGKTRQDSCGGDSGGPLQRMDNYNGDARYIQYGVISFGAKTCGRVGVPGVYTRLDYYTQWILDSLKP